MIALAVGRKLLKNCNGGNSVAVDSEVSPSLRTEYVTWIFLLWKKIKIIHVVNNKTFEITLK
jgi:hypothetical protein